MVTAIFRGSTLEETGYLIDIENVESALGTIATTFQDETLNELPAFEGLNPSAEHFARIIAERLVAEISPEQVSSVEIRLTEDDIATVGYTKQLPSSE